MRSLVGAVVALVVRLWIASLRYRRLGPPIGGPGLVAFWHGDQLALLGQRPPGELVAPISLSRDGRLQAAVMRRLGIAEAPGSSSRGGARAARGLLRALARGAVALLAVDGPRGPRHVVKPGVVFLARRSGLPVWPVGVAVGAGRRLASPWDRFLLPRPFTRTWVVVGAPLTMAADADPEEARLELEAAMHAVSAEASRMRGA